MKSRARGGMVITTGRFSKAAVEFTESLLRDGIQIQLVDRGLLADMGVRAGIDLVIGGRAIPVSVYDVSGMDRLQQVFAAYLNGLYESRPERPSRLLEIRGREIRLVPVYAVRYDILAIFGTSVGVVHREALRDGRFFLDGENGTLLRPDLSVFFAPLPTRQYSSEAFREWRAQQRVFALDIVTIKGRAKGEIIRRHTRTVSYVGHNNRRYTKICEPSEKSFTLTDIRQLYLPVSRSIVRILSTIHQLDYLEHPAARLHPLDNTLFRCGICGQMVSNHPYLCNVCGMPAHPKRLLRSHGFDCNRCQRTMCRACAKFVRRFLFKRVVCPTCISQSTKDLASKVRAFPPIRR